jgi:hypothetical protein
MPPRRDRARDIETEFGGGAPCGERVKGFLSVVFVWVK